MKYPTTLKAMQALYLEAKEAYFNDEPIMTDAQFDKLEDMIKQLAPKWAELKKTGVATKKEKAELPNYMPSLSKCYPEQIESWLEKHGIERFMVMDKLDGAALHLSYLDGKPYKLYTRGDGTVGGDISFLIPKLSLPKIKDKSPRSFRCEAVMSKRNFKKYAKEFENARNMVNGLLNRKATDKGRINPAMKEIDIVVLGVFGSLMETGLEYAKTQGFKVVGHAITDDIRNLSLALAVRKVKSAYEVDGLVVTSVGALFQYSNADKPTWVTAYKENVDDVAENSEVVRVIYQVSNRRRIIPKIEIKPIRLDGATVKFVTCNNAKWMRDRRIGPGAVVRVLRSGGVIPKIVGVVKPGTFQAPTMKYILDGVHFMVDGDADKAANRDIGVQSINKFLGTLGVEFIAVKTIQSLYDAGCTTPFHYMKLAQVGKLSPMVKAGVGTGNAEKIMKELQRVFKDTPLLKLMVASNLFGVGVGERRLTAIQASGISMTKLLQITAQEAVNQIMVIPGFQEKTTRVVVEGLKAFKKFLATAQKLITIKDVKPRVKQQINGKLTGIKISFTGYRSKEEEEKIIAAGGEVVSFGSRTQVLLYSATGKASAKVTTAKAKGIKTMMFKDLKV